MSAERAKDDTHAPGGLGFTYCGLRMTKKHLLWSGDPDTVTGPSCRAALRDEFGPAGDPS